MSTASASVDPKRVVGYAERLTQMSQRVSSKDEHPGIYLVPKERAIVSTKLAFRSYSCLVRSAMPSPHKVIMVVGATGAGKSTLINAMANYILGVKWEDDFRFKLVHETGTGTQAESQTQNITTYTIHINDHLNVPYTLTIIDTPGFGDSRGIDRDKAIVKKIREFFTNPESHGVDQIHAVGFVVQSPLARLTKAQRYVFESILAVFGKNIEPNIMLLITFSDGQSPPVLNAVEKANVPYGKMFKFNNSALFAGRGGGGALFDAACWQMVYASMKEFINTLNDLQPQSLSLTVEVLKEREHLEIVLKGLQTQILIACNQKERLNNLKKALEKDNRDMEANEYEVEVQKLEKIPHPGKGSTNCSNCLFTCHSPCTFSNFKFWCHAMTWFGKCTVCPGKCSSRKHVHEFVSYDWTTVKVKQTYAEIQNQYLDPEGRKQGHEAVIKEVEADLANAEAAVNEIIKESHGCAKRLEEIALKPNPVGVIEYIDMLIETEKATQKRGWQKKVAFLEATKQSEKTKKAITDTAASGIAVKAMWNKMVKQFGY